MENKPMQQIKNNSNTMDQTQRETKSLVVANAVCPSNVAFDGFINSKVYHSPRLWYLRVSVIEAEHIMPGHKGPKVVRFPEFFAKLQVQNQCLRTGIAAPSSTRSFSNPYWNEELMFVVDEPFVNSLWVSVEDRIEKNNEVVAATMELPVATIENRVDERPIVSGWFDLKTHIGKASDNNKPRTRFVPRIHLRVSLDGGYHVFEEVPLNSSDVRPSDTTLWKPPIGVLEMHILGATGLMPVQIKDSEVHATNVYCIAKYGQKWCRTRKVVASLSPMWNEQYNWEVYDLCTVVTVAVFYNCLIVKNNTNDARASDYGIGKVRIGLSTLEANRFSTHSYPLLMLDPPGVKEMGELRLAIKLSCSNVAKMLHMYTMPWLPRMHYVDPLTVSQIQSLRHQAKNLLAWRLSREEPPLGNEIVEYILDDDTWSIRRSRVNLSRLIDAFSSLVVVGRYLKAIRDWWNPISSTLFLIIFVVLMMLPEFIIPSIMFFMAFKGLWRYCFPPQYPPLVSTRLLRVDTIIPDELDEELDTIPTSRSDDVVRMRYDVLRFMAGRIQNLMEVTAEQLEQLQALLRWADPRASFLSLVLCLVAAVGFYFVPIRVVVALLGLYLLRPPCLRSKAKSVHIVVNLKAQWFDLLLRHANLYENVYGSTIGREI